MYILAGDIGGTKSHLGLFFHMRCIKEKKYLNSNYSDFSQIVVDFLRDEKIVLDKISLGLAGPVRSGVSVLTNLNWVIDADALARQYKVDTVLLINDIEAHVYGLCALESKDLFLLKKGKEDAERNRAMLALGTGLGEAGIYWDGKRYLPFASEGGHRDFAPREDLEIELFNYLKSRYGHVSCERVLSGRGLVDLFFFLIDVKKEGKPSWLANEHGEDLSKCIIEKALNKECFLSERVVRWFTSIYGSEVGNVALNFLALNGVFLSGGITHKIAPFLKEKEFLQAFEEKGRFHSLLATISIHLVLNENIALLGAAAFASYVKG